MDPKRKNGLDEAIAVLRQGIQQTNDPHFYLLLSQALQKQKVLEEEQKELETRKADDQQKASKKSCSCC